MRAAEPSGPIQLIPPGLLGLLQIKSPAGQNPNVLNADVQPCVDILPWWLRANRQVWAANSGINIAAAIINDFMAFSPNSIIVPQNQWWYIHSYNVAVAAGAAGTALGVRQAMRWNTVGTIKYQALGEGPARSNEPLTAASGAILLKAEGFWMPPGSELGFYVGVVTGGDLQVTVRGMAYTPCPI
jgi:hypothetical protein